MQLLQDTPDCTIHYDPTQNWLLVTWLGTQLTRTAHARCVDILACVRATGSTKMLNDGSQDEAGWSELTPWVARIFLPQLAAAGVVAVAWVIPHNLRARTCMDKVLAASIQPGVAAFAELEAAHTWLGKTVKHPSQSGGPKDNRSENTE